MADGMLEYVLSLKDQMSAKLKGAVGHVGRARQSLGRLTAAGARKFGGGIVAGAARARKAVSSMASFGVRSLRRLSIAAVGVSVGMLVFAAKASKAWLDKAKSIGEVRRALMATGQASRENLQYLGKLTDWLQETANVSDDAGDAAVAYALRLGIGTEEMGKFMKTSLALSKVIGTDLIGGVRQLVRAQAGSTEMLSRYGIVLDATKSKAEQYNDLQQQMIGMYDKGIAKVDDAGSKWDNFKLALADAVKYVGKNIVEGLRLEKVIDMLRGGMKDLNAVLLDDNNPFRAWLNDVRAVALDVATLIAVLSDADLRKNLGEDLKGLVSSAFSDAGLLIENGFISAVNHLMRAAPVIGAIIRDKIMEAWSERGKRKELIEDVGTSMAKDAWNAMPDWQQRSQQKNKPMWQGGGAEDLMMTQARFMVDFRKKNEEAIRDEAKRRMLEQATAEGADVANKFGLKPGELKTPAAWDSLTSSDAFAEKRAEIIEKGKQWEKAGQEESAEPLPPPGSGGGSAGGAPIARRTRATGMLGQNSSYGMLDHLQSVGAQVREWKPGDKTLGDLHKVMEKVEQNTRGLADEMTQE